MEEYMDMARMLRDSPDLLPWVVFVFVAGVILLERKMIKEYFSARMDYWRSRKETDAIIPEVIRNNTAALEHNTASIERWSNDRGENRRMLEEHERASQERERHLQEVINRVDRTANENARKLDIIEDRTEK